MLTVDLFPINKEVLPQIYVYEVETSENKNLISGKAAYRMRKEFKGHWASNYGRILSDKKVEQSDISIFLKKLWQPGQVQLNNVRSITLNKNYRLSESDIASFVARAMTEDAKREINIALNDKKIEVQKAEIKRISEFSGYVVSSKASLAISVSSNILLKQDLDYYIRKGKNPIGWYAKVKYQSMKGEVVGIVGSLKENRERLLGLAQDDESIRPLKTAPDDIEVITIKRGTNFYDYPANSLEIVLTPQNCKIFGVSSRDISKYTKMNPKDRQRMIETTRDVLNRKLDNNGILIGERYSSEENSTLFPKMFDLPFKEPVMVGQNHVCNFQGSAIQRGLSDYGLYKHSEKLTSNTIRIGVLYPNSYGNKKVMTDFLDSVKRELTNLKMAVEIANFLKFNFADVSDMEKQINEFKKDNTDLILAILPGTLNEDGDIDDVDVYHTFKRLTITKGIGGQVVNYGTLSNSFALYNIILGILGKTGNIPYKLSKPLEFCDVVVGLDIARKKKEKLQGSNNAAAIARVYFNDGDFLRYVIHDAPLEGETVPPEVLKSLFPLDEFEGKKVIIHRDGYFRGEERDTLEKWGASIGAKFSLVEVIKREAPRLYKEDNKGIESPEKGSVFQLDPNQALVISSPPPFKGSTPRPLKVIKKSGDIDLKQAIRSVLSLTELHYGSLNPPRLPVTIHYSDQIAWFALRGIKPPNLTGDVPFWL